MINTWYSVRTLSNDRVTKHKIFKTEEAKDNFEKDLMVRGLKITGQFSMVVNIEDYEST